MFFLGTLRNPCGSLDPTLETTTSQKCPQQHEWGHFQCLVWDSDLTELRGVLESCSPGLDLLAISSVGPGCLLQNYRGGWRGCGYYFPEMEPFQDCD